MKQDKQKAPVHNWKILREDEYHVYYHSDLIGETRVYKQLQEHIAATITEDILSDLDDTIRDIAAKQEQNYEYGEGVYEGCMASLKVINDYK